MPTRFAGSQAKVIPSWLLGTSRTVETRRKKSAPDMFESGHADGDLDPEVLIVGAGAVGLVLGISLARAGRRVTLIEGGPADPPADYMARNHGPNSGVEHLGLIKGRMKALGGTTRLWGGQLAPFSPSDFRATYAGKPTWPLSLETLQPWFERAFEFLGLDKVSRSPSNIWASVGVAPIDLGPALTAITNSWLPVADFTKLFAADIASLPHLRIVTDMEASTLEFASNGRATAIIATALDGKVHRFSAPQIVLANGTMEIVRLLLRAAATAPHCPFAANQNIGRCFIDHLHGIVGRVEGGDLARLRATFGNIRADGRKYSIKVRASDAFLESHGIAHCAVTFYANGSIRQAWSGFCNLFRRAFARGDWRRIGATLVEAARTTRMLLPILWVYLVRRLAHARLDRGILLGLEIEQIPVAESRLLLDPTAPPGTGAIGVHWALDGRELVAADLFCAELARSFAERGLGTIKVDPRIAARDTTLFEELHDAFHHMGGARMAESVSEGVVDRDLRVFGCPNLSIAGAATFPSGSFANPTLTALALALRLTARLAAELTVIGDGAL
jgi:choline dehydrogenase-like flavoprotein